MPDTLCIGYRWHRKPRIKSEPKTKLDQDISVYPNCSNSDYYHLYKKYQECQDANKDKINNECLKILDEINQ